MATTGFRRKMTTIFRSSADVPFASRRGDAATGAKPCMLGFALFYVMVIAIFALRVTVWLPESGQ